MGLLEILLLGVALATDAFSVTISNTFAFDDHRFSRLMRMPLFWSPLALLPQFSAPLLCSLAKNLVLFWATVPRWWAV